jgi:hypothetical protein
MKNFLFFCFIFVLSCQTQELINPEISVAGICGVNNPLQDLPWLKDQLQKAEATPDNPCALWQVTQGVYQGQTVFIIGVGGALCCTCAGSSVYNCEGKLVFVCEPEKEAAITDKKVIWKRSQAG